MKKVKFNVRTSFRVGIKDAEKLEDIRTKMAENELEDVEKSYKQLHILAGRYAMKDVNVGDIIEVPDWYFEAKKDQTVLVSNSFSKYKDKMGRPVPFNAEEALRHGDMTSINDTMKRVKLFDLIIEEKKTDEKKSK